MSGISASLTKWFSERPQWLQIAATRLLQQSELTDTDVSELANLCQQEADAAQNDLFLSCYRVLPGHSRLPAFVFNQ